MPKNSASNRRPNPVFEIVMDTDVVMRGELYPSVAPQTVGNFIALANSCFYDGLCFHRCIQDYIIQAGQPLDGELPYSILGEFEFNQFKQNYMSHKYGSFCMARAGHYNSANSQFYIVTTHNDRELNCLTGAYAVFGAVLEGMKYAEAISSVNTDAQDEPLHLQRIRRIRVETFGGFYPFEKLTPPTSDINTPKIRHRQRRDQEEE